MIHMASPYHPRAVATEAHATDNRWANENEEAIVMAKVVDRDKTEKQLLEEPGAGTEKQLLAEPGAETEKQLLAEPVAGMEV